MQLILFGFAINSDPKHLPAGVLLADHGPQGRTLLHAISNSSYFDFVREVDTEAEGPRRAIARGEVQFVVNIPGEFHARSPARRPAHAPRRSGRDRSGRHRQRRRLAARSAHTRPAERSSRARSPIWPHAPAPSTCASTTLYNPEGDHAVQHRARPDGRGPDDDDGHDHRPGHHPRARARHHGEPALHARRIRRRC